MAPLVRRTDRPSIGGAETQAYGTTPLPGALEERRGASRPGVGRRTASGSGFERGLFAPGPGGVGGRRRHAFGDARQGRGAEHRGLRVGGTADGDTEHVGLELAQRIRYRAGATVDSSSVTGMPAASQIASITSAVCQRHRFHRPPRARVRPSVPARRARSRAARVRIEPR